MVYWEAVKWVEKQYFLQMEFNLAGWTLSFMTVPTYANIFPYIKFEEKAAGETV